MMLRVAVAGRRARLASLCAGQEECGQHSNVTLRAANLLNLTMLLLEFHAIENSPVQNPKLQTA
jgi:hypothetical protein